MTYTFYSNIPAGPNDPQDDQPLMLTNNASIAGLIQVDHVGFNQVNGGYHEQVTFNAKNVPVGTPTDPVSVIYTNSGTASTVSQALFKNQNGIFPLSAIRAFATFTTSPFAQPVNYYNLNPGTPVTNLGGGLFRLNLLANAITGSNISVFITYKEVVLAMGGWSTSGGNVTIDASAASAPGTVSVMVLQF